MQHEVGAPRPLVLLVLQSVPSSMGARCTPTAVPNSLGAAPATPTPLNSTLPPTLLERCLLFLRIPPSSAAAGHFAILILTLMQIPLRVRSEILCNPTAPVRVWARGWAPTVSTLPPFICARRLSAHDRSSLWLSFGALLAFYSVLGFSPACQSCCLCLHPAPPASRLDRIGISTPLDNACLSVRGC